MGLREIGAGKKTLKGFLLTPIAIEQIDALSKKLGLSNSEIVERAVMEFQKKVSDEGFVQTPLRALCEQKLDAIRKILKEE